MSEDSSNSARTKITSKKNITKPNVDFGGPIRVVATATVIVFFGQVAAALIVLFIYSLVGGPTDISKVLNDTAVSQLIFILLNQVLGVYLVYLVLRRRRLSLKMIGFNRWPKWRDLGFSVAGILSYYLLLLAITISISVLVPSFDLDQAQNIGFESIANNTDKLAAFMALVVLAPIGEEVLMRGYLYSGLRFRMGFASALLITSMIFGLAHLEFGGDGPPVWIAGLATFVLSAVLVYAREKTGALYAPIAMHCANNFVAFIIHFM